MNNDNQENNLDDYQVMKAVEKINEVQDQNCSTRNKIIITVSTLLLIGIILTIILLLVLKTKTPEPKPKEDVLKKLAKDLILYYDKYKSKGEVEYQRIYDKIRLINESQLVKWENIINYWKYVDNKLIINEITIPEGLTNDNTLCIIILGYKLKSDGTMDEELINRLEAGLKIANTYNNSYIAVSGGASSGKKGVTEGDLMAKWLLDNHIERERLIVEQNSTSTVENVKFLYQIFVDKYKHIDKFVIVSSSYHIKRASILLYTEIIRQKVDYNGIDMIVISNYAAKATKKDGHYIAKDIGELNGINITKSDKAPELSVPIDLIIKSDLYYNIGDLPKFIVYAIYNSNFTYDVTSKATHTPIEGFTPGKIKVTFVYSYNGIEINKNYYIYYSAKAN